MSDFGDFDPDDAFDTEPADPFQVAIKLHRLRRKAGLETRPWERLSTTAQTGRIAIAAALLAWMRRQGAD
jgi:hypothetical protein